MTIITIILLLPLLLLKVFRVACDEETISLNYDKDFNAKDERLDAAINVIHSQILGRTPDLL